MTYEFGTHKDRNYNLQYFRDSKDSTMRYVYALVWYQGMDRSVKGSVYKFYSKDPQAYKMSLSYKMNAVQGLDSLVYLGNVKYNRNLARSYDLEMTPPRMRLSLWCNSTRSVLPLRMPVTNTLIWEIR